MHRALLRRSIVEEQDAKEKETKQRRTMSSKLRTTKDIITMATASFHNPAATAEAKAGLQMLMETNRNVIGHIRRERAIGRAETKAKALEKARADHPQRPKDPAPQKVFKAALPLLPTKSQLKQLNA